MSNRARAVFPEPATVPNPNGYILRQCSECGAPMLLMSATPLVAWPGVIRKSYECIVCKSIDQKIVSINSDSSPHPGAVSIAPGPIGRELY
jgi:hypothetical protein